MCLTGVWGGGAMAREWFSLWTALKRRPQLLGQSHGLTMQCKCSCTMKTALKSHFLWKYIFLRLLLHRITVTVSLTFDNSIFRLKTSWDNFSSISWERKMEDTVRNLTISNAMSQRKKERKKKRLHSNLSFLPLLVPGLLSQLQLLSMLLNFLFILKSNKNYGKIQFISSIIGNENFLLLTSSFSRLSLFISSCKVACFSADSRRSSSNACRDANERQFTRVLFLWPQTLQK